MGKSKTQAQKQEEREEKLRQENEKRQREKQEKDANIKESLQRGSDKPVINNNNNLSKKELRKLKKEQEEIRKTKPETTSVDPFLPVFKSKEEDSDEMSNRIDRDLQKKAREDAAKELSSNDGLARLVENHSTYCEGLKSALYRLRKILPTGCTISPGEISTCSTNIEVLELRIQRGIDKTHTYHCVARKGKTAQDVYITVTQSISEAILKLRIDSVLDDSCDRNDDAEDISDVRVSQYNRAKAEAKENTWREKHSEQHKQRQEKCKQAKEQKEEKALERTLKTKGVEDAAALAKRDHEIITGSNRTKNSMK